MDWNKIDYWMEWILRAYFIVMIIFLVVHWNIHPELYNVVDKRPTLLNSDFVNNENNWQYKASTIEECKPMTNLYNFIKLWILPYFILLIVFGIIRLYKWMEKKQLLQGE